MYRYAFSSTSRTDIIQYLINKFQFTSYLEIGIHKSENFNKIIIDYKVSVDPDINTNAIYHLTSDDFFTQNKEKFDIIFIDGLHTAEQVKKDIVNSLKVLNRNGYIIVHDCNPLDEFLARSVDEFLKDGYYWNGDVYKGYLEAVQEYNLAYATVDTDWGVGVISGHKMNYLDIEDLTYEKFDKNREKLLNLISPSEFINYIQGNKNV